MQVSSANYEARAYGIRADMTIGAAKQMCPDLVVMPYQYDIYQEVSEKASFLRHIPCPPILFCFVFDVMSIA